MALAFGKVKKARGSTVGCLEGRREDYVWCRGALRARAGGNRLLNHLRSTRTSETTMMRRRSPWTTTSAMMTTRTCSGRRLPRPAAAAAPPGVVVADHDGVSLVRNSINGSPTLWRLTVASKSRWASGL